MPTYDYICGCGARFERYCSISERLSQTCPDCGALGDRLISCPEFTMNKMTHGMGLRFGQEEKYPNYRHWNSNEGGM